LALFHWFFRACLGFIYTTVAPEKAPIGGATNVVWLLQMSEEQSFRVLLTPLAYFPVGHAEWRFFRRNPKSWTSFSA
jgi:hypothetical protein